MRYSITLSYDGLAFCGWQIQPHSPSVQQTLQDAMNTLLQGCGIELVGAGRTDTGVSAKGYVAHFDCDESVIGDCTDFCYKLNAILPAEIAISTIKRVDDDFHARFDAKRREYTYFLHRKKDPFARTHSWLCGYPELDMEKMNRAAALLVGRHDFSCFEKSGGAAKTSICTIFEAGWKTTEDADHWEFKIAGDRFLRNMVRAIVGTLVEVGRAKRSEEDFASLILPPEEGAEKTVRRSLAGESAPAAGLLLSKIEY